MEKDADLEAEMQVLVDEASVMLSTPHFDSGQAVDLLNRLNELGDHERATGNEFNASQLKRVANDLVQRLKSG